MIYALMGDAFASARPFMLLAALLFYGKLELSCGSTA